MAHRWAGSGQRPDPSLHNPVVLVGKADARTGLSLIADRLRPLHGPEQMASPHARTPY